MGCTKRPAVWVRVREPGIRGIQGPDGADHDDRRKKSHIQLSRGQPTLSGKMGRFDEFCWILSMEETGPPKKASKNDAVQYDKLAYFTYLGDKINLLIYGLSHIYKVPMDIHVKHPKIEAFNSDWINLCQLNLDMSCDSGCWFFGSYVWSNILEIHVTLCNSSCWKLAKKTKSRFGLLEKEVHRIEAFFPSTCPCPRHPVIPHEEVLFLCVLGVRIPFHTRCLEP